MAISSDFCVITDSLIAYIVERDSELETLAADMRESKKATLEWKKKCQRLLWAKWRVQTQLNMLQNKHRKLHTKTVDVGVQVDESYFNNLEDNNHAHSFPAMKKRKLK